MVRHVSTAVDDDLGERLDDIMDDRDWSWAELLENTADVFEQEQNAN